MNSDQLLRALTKSIRKQHWTRIANTDSEIRIATIKTFLIHRGFDFSHSRFAWQNRFIGRWFVAPWAQPEIRWESVLESVNQLSAEECASGRTTMLALLLAVEDCLPENPRLWSTGFPDHWATRVATRLLHREARFLQRAWRDYIAN